MKVTIKRTDRLWRCTVQGVQSIAIDNTEDLITLSFNTLRAAKIAHNLINDSGVVYDYTLDFQFKFIEIPNIKDYNISAE